jgi:hypothetical protein
MYKDEISNYEDAFDLVVFVLVFVRGRYLWQGYTGRLPYPPVQQGRTVCDHRRSRESVRWHEQLIGNTEELVQARELPNRVVNVCTGDMGDGKVGMYDLEC